MNKKKRWLKNTDLLKIHFKKLEIKEKIKYSECGNQKWLKKKSTHRSRKQI